MAVDKAHDVAGSFVCDFNIVGLFRKHPRLLGTGDNCTTDGTRLVAVLPAHRSNTTEKLNSYNEHATV